MIHRTRVACNTGTGTQDITISGIGTPVAAMFFLTTATGALEASHMLISSGVTDGTNHRCAIMAAENGVTPTNTWTKLVNDKPIITLNATTGVIDSVAGFDSWITDGVRINWTDAPPGAYFLHVIFFVGDFNLAIGDFDSNTDTSETIGFSLDQMWLAGVNSAYSSGFTAASSTSGDAQGSFSMGIVDNGPLLRQGTLGWFGIDASVGLSDDCHSIIVNSLAFSDALEAEVGVVPTSTGFTISAVAGRAAMWYFAIGYKGKLVHRFLELETPTGTGSQTLSGQGFKPMFVFELQSVLSSYNTADSGAAMGWGIGIATNEGTPASAVAGRYLTAGLSPCLAVSRQEIAISRARDGAAGFQLLASLTSLNEDGYTKNWTQVSGTARKIVALTAGLPPFVHKSEMGPLAVGPPVAIGL